MKHTTPDVFLTRELLCYVRDERPASEEFVARFGEQCFHVPRKAGVIVLEDHRLRLTLRHLSPDGNRFVWGAKLIHLDQDRVDIIRWEPGGPPVFKERP
jgi:hypothetical protein